MTHVVSDVPLGESWRATPVSGASPEHRIARQRRVASHSLRSDTTAGDFDRSFSPRNIAVLTLRLDVSAVHSVTRRCRGATPLQFPSRRRDPGISHVDTGWALSSRRQQNLGLRTVCEWTTAAHSAVVIEQRGGSEPSVGTRVVIVDDVMTTGASIDAATDACVTAGLRVVGVLVVAIAEPQGATRHTAQGLVSPVEILRGSPNRFTVE